MNPAQKQVARSLRKIPAAYAGLRDIASRYARYCSQVDPYGLVQVGHMPWEASLAYAVQLYPPAKADWFTRYSRRTGTAIPPAYREFLLITNGCEVFEMSLYGLTPSMQRTEMLDRTVIQCFDLQEANQTWWREFTAETGLFHFGSRNTSNVGQVGYFWGEEGIRAIHRTSGRVAGKWADFSSMLNAELTAAEEWATRRIPDSWWH